jgi:phosphoribosylamine--glycine ligase
MKLLVIGSGGREHAIIKKLKESPDVTEIFCAPGNGGIAADAVCVPIKATDIPAVVAFAVEKKIDFAVVAPDDPLVLGMVDALEEQGIPCFGPNKAAARIEGSKVFSKAFMKRHGIPTAAYEPFDNLDNAMAYVKTAAYPLWIKTDGLALGKGAISAVNPEEAAALLTSLMSGEAFGESGKRVVIEENMTGPEVTVLLFSDGKSIAPMVSSMDHKRVFDGDKGSNTGGMGTIAPNPHYTADIAARCMEEIFLPTIRGMAAEGCPFHGCLYVGLMLTPTGPKVIEYNCRFGDPETQVVLPLLDADLLAVFQACRDGNLDSLPIRWKAGAAACIMLASGGYPGKYATGLPISGLDENGQLLAATIYHSGTRRDSEAFLTAGGRVLGVAATGGDLDDALSKAYAAAENVAFEGIQYRRDIGRY